MSNTIIDFIRIPTDEYGKILYDVETIKKLFNKYLEKTGHEAIVMPADITIWEDLDIISLKMLYQYLEEIIEKKEKQNKKES